MKCEGIQGAENDACIEAVLKEIVVEVGKPGNLERIVFTNNLTTTLYPHSELDLFQQASVGLETFINEWIRVPMAYTILVSFVLLAFCCFCYNKVATAKIKTSFTHKSPTYTFQSTHHHHCQHRYQDSFGWTQTGLIDNIRGWTRFWRGWNVRSIDRPEYWPLDLSEFRVGESRALVKWSSFQMGSKIRKN